jgi:hypothetical protein
VAAQEGFRLTRRGVIGGVAVTATVGAASWAAVSLSDSGSQIPQSATARGSQLALVPSRDQTGAADSSAITAAFSRGYGEVILLPGTYFLGSPVTIPDDRTLSGCGTGTILVPAKGISGAMVQFGGSNTMVRDLQVFGGSETTSDNPVADVFAPSSGTIRWWICNVAVSYCNGWVLNPQPPVTPMHGSVYAIQGTNNVGGIRLAGGKSHGGQVNIGDVNLQSCETNEALLLQDITDVAVSNFNASVIGQSAASTVHVTGNCQAVTMNGINAGVMGSPGPEAAVLRVDVGASGGSPSEIDFSGCIFQDGGVGVWVSEDASRLRFRGVIAKNNAGDGWRFDGTGSAILVDGCQAIGNNGAGGTASDVFVTSTAHVGLFAFAYASPAVASSRQIVPANNNVTDAYSTSPGGRPTAGAAPRGW